MAQYGNLNEEDSTIASEALARPEYPEFIGVAPAKMDEMLLEALNALEHAKALHETTPNPEIKRQTKRILESLHAALEKLAPLGIHSLSRLERVPVG